MFDSILRVATGAAVLQGMMVQRLIVTPAFHCRCHVHVLTDVEGDRAYLDRYVNQSKVLAFAKPTEDDYYTKPFYYRHIVFQNIPKNEEDEENSGIIGLILTNQNEY